jgi:segregation and condensation protein A
VESKQKLADQFRPIPEIAINPESESQSISTENDNWLEKGPEMLVEMAKTGEIDPWNVDLVFVIDKFLSQLQGKKDKNELQEAARIFFVSVLLRIKSQLIYTKPDLNEASGEEFDDLMNFDSVDFEELDGEREYTEILHPKALDNVLRRNPSGLKESRKRQITLDDLIDLFKEVESKTSKKKTRKKTSLKDFEELDEVVLREDEDTDIYDLAVDENLEQKIEILSNYILEKLEVNRQTALSSLNLLFGDKIDTFLSALFLTHAGRTEIIQKVFYDEIWLKRVT